MQKTETKQGDGLKIWPWMLETCGGCNARAAMLAAIYSYCKDGARTVSQKIAFCAISEKRKRENT